MALTLTYKGFNYVDFYDGIYDTTNLDTTMPSVAATGSDSVALTPDYGIDVATSTVYAGNSTTDTVADLTAAVKEATAEGMTSLVRPLIDILYPQVSPHNGAPNYYVPNDFTFIFDPGGTGATTISYTPSTSKSPGDSYVGDTPAGTTPSSIPKGTADGNFVNYRGYLETTDEPGGDLNAATFFGSPTTVGSYDYMIVSEAEAAAAAGATLFSVGVELDNSSDTGLANDPADTSYWDALIADVRAAAPSLKLTYSANWADVNEITFWNKLDYVGIDAYVPLSNVVPNAANNNNPSLASLEAGWNAVSNVVVAYSGGETVSQALENEGLGDVSVIDAFDTVAQQSISKQLILTELGYENDTGAATDPTGGSATGVADPSLQAELFSAFFGAWGAAQATAAANGGKVDGIPFSLIGAYFWDYVPDGSNDGWSPELNPAAAAVINSNFATVNPVTVFAETNIAGVGGYEGQPTAARGSAGTSGTGALAGDSDANGAALSITAITGGTVGTSYTTKYGSLTLDANGSYTYFPTNSTSLQDAPTGAPAADVINFTVADANGATATSSLAISVYRDPVVFPVSASTAAGGTVNGTAGSTGTGALAGDSDPDGVSLSVAAINDLGEPISNPIAGNYGTLTLNANGSYSYVADSAAALASAFSADSGAPLTDGFSLFVSGGLGTYSLTTLAVTIDDTGFGALSGDGKSDALMTFSNGALVLDEISGGQEGYTQIGALGPEWDFEGDGAIAGDGKDQFLLWYGTNDSPTYGSIVLGEDDGGTASYTKIGSIGPEWQFEGVGPLAGGNASDVLLWYGTDDSPTYGALVVGADSNGSLSYTDIGALGPEWKFEGVGGYLNNGSTDFLIWDTSSSSPIDGSLVVGQDVGGSAQYTLIGGLGPSTWQFEGSGDLLGDGKESFLLWDGNGSDANYGALVVGEINGGAVGYTRVGAVGPQWQFLGVGDYDGASSAEFLMLNGSTGALVLGTIANGAASYAQVGAVSPTAWNFHATNVATVV